MAKKQSSAANKIQYPVCVRHAEARKDVRLRHWFLCDRCAAKWVAEAFGGSRSLYDGEELTGYCLLCNAVTSVRLRTWFLCDICWRVAGSIGRNHIAESAIVDWWRGHIEPTHPHLRMTQNDESSLRPRRKTDISGESPIDFLIRDEEAHEVVLAIENKTGRSSIREMSAFQLDVSDCDCMLHDVRKYNVPAYLIHAQVLERWNPPTVGFEAIGLWWTDIFQLAEHFRDVKMRRDENRGAAYFAKGAFHDMSELASSLFNGAGHLSLVERLRREGLPTLYRSG
jgi:hypothetical protein